MFNLNSRKQNFRFLIKILITKYDFLGYYLRLNLLILAIVNKISSIRNENTIYFFEI